METITYAQAAKALAESLATGEPGVHQFYITAAEPVMGEEGLTIYMVGRASADPEEDDEDGDPTGFITGPDGRVLCTGPVF